MIIRDSNLNTRRHQHGQSFDTDSVQSGFFLILYLQVPHLPDLGRNSLWGDGGTTIQQ